jgi:uncharacterized protein
MTDRVVGILSDTHGWFDPQFESVFQGVDLLLHAGDIGDASVLDAMERVAPVRAVYGNIDGHELRHLPETDVVELGGLRIGLLHIAGSPRRPKRQARQLIARERLDLFVCGHSHVPVVGRVDGCVWLNPGAAGRQGFHTERFALRLRIPAEGEYSLDRIHLGPRSTRGITS